ncbi:gp53-like domain-containing protein [Citrobacter braakii]|uniref:gp53-like domain-containing protein n=2 Tax=Citrobacter braakii TaxID=57706 RepID=UPI0037AC054A
MYHVDNSTGVPVMPQPSPVTSETELFFTEGGNGVPPTFPGPDWFNIIQSELINILRAAGLDPDKMDNTQILAALKKLFLSRSNPFGDIKADGAAAIATALSNLGLGEAAKRAVGNSTNQIPDMSFFTLSMGQSGYQKFPSGLILQWGVVALGNDGNAFATLPIAFPNGIHGGLAGEAAPTGWASNSCVIAAFDLAQSSRNGVTIRARSITGTNGPSSSTATLSARYFCWGY